MKKLKKIMLFVVDVTLTFPLAVIVTLSKGMHWVAKILDKFIVFKPITYIIKKKYLYAS